MVAYLRATLPSTPNVEATALQPPSMASLTMFSRIEIFGIRANCAGRMLDPLVHRQDRHVARARQPAVVIIQARLPITRVVAIAGHEDAVDEIGAGQMELLLRNCAATMFEQFRAFRPQQF